MKHLSLSSIISLAFFSLLLFSCTNKKEAFELRIEKVSEYIPLSPGKYITYRLDSLVFTNFQKIKEVHSYQQKHIVDALITDNLGRPSYRILKFIRDTAGKQAWRSDGSYFITVLDNSLEVIEDNRRIIKLIGPIQNDYTWKGNAYIPDNYYSPLYQFNNDNFMSTWEFMIKGTKETFNLSDTQQVKDVLTVLQVDNKNLIDTFEVTNNAVTIPANIPAAFIRGNATDSIIINAAVPTSNKNVLSIYNWTNNVAKLNKTSIPNFHGRSYEYLNSQWQFKDGKDTLRRDLPLGSVDYGIEKFAKNQGLVFREFIMWEYQPDPSGNFNYKYSGFGVSMRMIDHN